MRMCMEIVSDALHTMLLILDGNSEHAVHTWWKRSLFGEKKIRFVTAFDQIKCPLKGWNKIY